MEAMALESLVASVWRLDGFLSVTRHPVWVDRGYSDIDVVGVRGDGVVRVAECKARGSALQVFVESRDPQWSSWWDNALENIPRLWSDEQRPAWLPAMTDVKLIEYHLVGNIWFVEDAARCRSESRLDALVQTKLPPEFTGKTKAVITPSIQLLLAAIAGVRKEVVEKGWGKRYGDPLLDAIRELVRYTHPWPSGGGRIGTRIKEQVRRELLAAVFGTEQPPEVGVP
jgi:hypothetical protein